MPAAAPAAPAAPAAAQPAAADAANWCSNLRIAFFPGGPQGGVFANNVYNGAKQAQADLGPKVDYVFSDWDPQKMIQQFKEVAATKPDGIAVMGHPGDEAFDAIIRDAVKNGIIVTSQNTPLPIVQGEFTANGFGYVGADLYGAGASLGTGGGVREKNICHRAACQPEADAHRVLHGELPRLIADLRIQTRDLRRRCKRILSISWIRLIRIGPPPGAALQANGPWK